MTLTNRLLAFLILAHFALLAGFSIAVYCVARAELYRRLDERNEAALDTLAAAAELEPDGWDWEPHERRIGRSAANHLPDWALFDGAGRRIDGSPGGPMLDPFGSPEGHRIRATLDGQNYRIARRTLAEPEFPAPIPPHHAALVFVVAAPQAPVEELLSTLAWSLTAGSAAALLFVGLLGRWWCRRALAPVARMTGAVREIDTGLLAERIPEPVPRDELRELAESFNALLARMQLGYEQQVRFTAEASHQLRTPLAGMLGQLELAIKRERDPAEYRRAIASAIRGAEHLNAIVETLLFLARPEGESRIDELETVDLRDVANEHLNLMWSNHSRRADITVEAESDVGIATRPALLQQAIQNLLENAIKYSEPCAPITIRIARSDRGVEIEIRDEGRGIAPHDRDRIFEPFYRSDDAARSGIAGVGLGLAVARRILKSLGGTIRVDSQLGRGSTFTIGWAER